MTSDALESELCRHGPFGKAPSGSNVSDVTVFCFWLFAIGHILLWTLVPLLTQPNAPLDSIEMLYWGHEWQLGYYKHPPVPAWIAEFSTLLLGKSVWPTYLASQLCVVACFWAAWQLGRELLPPWQALCAAVLLEASYYYNFTTIELNNTGVSRAFWALSVLFLYRAMTRERNIWWILTGLTIAVGMGSKYYVVLLVLAMVAFGVLYPGARSRWKTAGPYLTLATAGLCFTPHLFWLWKHDFPTFSYFFERSKDAGKWLDHIINPLKFSVAQLAAVGPMVAVAALLIGKKWRFQQGNDESSRFNRAFLLFLLLGPPLTILLISMVSGAHMRSMWGGPLWTFVGVAVLYLFQSEISFGKVRRSVVVCALVSCVMAGGLTVRNLASPYVRHKGSRVHYPGQQLAQEIEQLWQKENTGYPEVVAGPWWPAANAAFYMKERASVYADLDPEKSPWLTDERLREKGGVVIWPLDRDSPETLQSLLKRFPDAKLEHPIELSWQTNAELEAVRLGVAVLPGNQSESTILR